MFTSTSKINLPILAKVGGTCITISFWCVLGVWGYNQFQNRSNTPVDKPIESEQSRDIETEKTVALTSTEIEIESFKPQLNTSTWGEIGNIVKSFETTMTECEGFDAENKIACYNHYKTLFWRQMKTLSEQKN